MTAVNLSEKKRLDTLHSYDILDTEETQEFDNLVKLAAQVCDVPIAKINFLDDKRTWSKANYGNDIKETPREYNFCHTTIKEDEFMVVEDASKDNRFKHFEFVSNAPNIRFYAGVNIKKNNQNLGTICVLGTEPRKLSEAQLDSLQIVANEIEARLELHRKNKDLETTTAFLKASVDLMLIVDPDTLQVEKCIQNGTKIFPEYNDNEETLSDLFPGWALLKKLEDCHAQGIDQLNAETSLLLENQEVHLEVNAIKKEGRWLITAKNITERVQAEMEVMREKLFSDTIINSLPVAFFMYDENGNMIRRNRVQTLEYGYTDNEHAEMSPLDFFEGEDLKKIKKYIKKAFDNKEPLGSIEADVIQKDGTKVPHLLNAISFLRNGKKYLIGTSQSIKDQRNYQNELEKLLAEKEVLLAEVHHRVKNNLAVISGFLQMQEFITESKDAKAVLLTNHMRVKSMALIHEDLYKLQDFSGIRFDEYLKNLIQFIEEKRSPSHANISVNLEISSFELNLNQAVPLALIIHELVSNAYEYAFLGRDKGTISISVKEVDQEVHLVIKDDGIGLPKGFVLEESPTLGATLVLTYSEQINSEINITSNNGQGTKYELVFNHNKNRKGSAANVLI
jgi:PAS domain S-box-containing protein